MVRISEIQLQFPEFLETFPGNSEPSLPLFPNFRDLWLMERTPFVTTTLFMPKTIIRLRLARQYEKEQAFHY